MPARLALFFLFLFGSMAAAQEKPAQQVEWPQLLAKLELQVERGMKNTGLPGVAVVIVHRDKVVYLRGFGVCEVGKQAPVTDDTVFQLASVSKSFTTTTLARLVGQGRISWDDRICDLHPGFVLHDPWISREVGLRDLLSHRSGLPAFAGDLLEDIGYNRSVILDRLRLVPVSGFRTKYAYTNFGFTMAAEAVARKLGSSWEDLCEAELYRPAGLKSTSSRMSDYSQAENRAVGHFLTDGKAEAKFVRDPDPQSPAGGVSSTARDLGRWIRLHLGGGKLDGEQLIDADALAQTYRPHILTGFNPASFGDSGFYGLGWNVSTDSQGNTILGHSGAFFVGARSKVTLIPKEELGIAVLANGNATGLPEGLTKFFFDCYFKRESAHDWILESDKMFVAFLESMAGASIDPEQPIANPSPPLPFSQYTGEYQNPYFGKLLIVTDEDALLMQMGPKQSQKCLLKHFNRDTFTYDPLGENGAGKTSAVHFRIGTSGKAGSLLIDHLNNLGLGEFTRVPSGAP